MFGWFTFNQIEINSYAEDNSRNKSSFCSIRNLYYIEIYKTTYGLFYEIKICFKASTFFVAKTLTN